MNDVAHDVANAGEWKSVAFTGRWTEFLPIALTNLLLTIVTLGIYRFWAAARQRRYLWSRTRFLDESLEWAGTGWEMFRGFLIVAAFLVLLLLIVGFGAQALVLRGEFVAAGAILFAVYAGLFFIINVAMFRALRYRLSRSYWRGIRGGSDDAGWSYGWSGIWKTVVAFVTLTLLYPWAMTSLWNDRWNKMSYGPYAFRADADSSGLMGRWLLIFGGTLAILIVAGVIMVGAGFAGAAVGGDQGAGVSIGGAAIFAILLIYIGIPILFLAYYAAYYRKVAASTTLGPLELQFTARTKDWLMLILGHIGLTIVTLGFGLMFIGYRNWKFAVSHLHARGELDMTALTQSATRAPGEAEGLADMFDIGAI